MVLEVLHRRDNAHQVHRLLLSSGRDLVPGEANDGGGGSGEHKEIDATRNSWVSVSTCPSAC